MRTQVGSRLVIDSITLQPEKARRNSMWSSPIDIKVTGGYHEFGSFVSGIAGMPAWLHCTIFQSRGKRIPAVRWSWKFRLRPIVIAIKVNSYD